VDGSAQRLITLASQWEKHRAPLIDEYRNLKDMASKTEVGVFMTVDCFIGKYV